MAKVLPNFMWQWQHVHHAAVSILFDKLLRANGVKYPAHVFILGLPEEQDLSRTFTHPIESGFAPTEFKDVHSRAREIFDADPDQHLILGAAHLHERFHEQRWPEAIRQAALEVFSSLDEARNTVTFLSFPVKVNDHWVMNVVQLNRHEYDRIARLSTSELATHSRRTAKVYRSFLDAVISTALAESVREIEGPSNGEDTWFAQPDRVLEDAAKRFVSQIGMRVNEWGASELIDLANAVAALRYEGTSSKGRLLLARKDHPGCQVVVRLNPPVSTRDHRGLRKLLEVSSEEMALLSDGNEVWGLGSVADTYNPDDEDLFEMQFVDHYTWELLHGSRSMLRLKYREPRLPGEKFDKSIFLDHVDRLFQQADEQALLQAVRAAVEQKKGTLMVITSEADGEAERFKAQSTLVEPLPASPTVVRQLSSIDGALLLTPQGELHAFGVILDGLASSNGDPSRGARYNSAIRYVDTQRRDGTSALTVVVSEDGYVDLYPLLRPRIPRRIVDERLEQLEELAVTEQFDDDKAWTALRDLDEIRFYLLDEDVERANKVRETVNKRYAEAMQETLTAGMGFIFPPFGSFEAQPEMNESFYEPEDN